MSLQSSAWLLDCGGGTVVAAGTTSVLHVIEDSTLLFRVPLAPTHCNRVLIWQQRVLPAVDLALRITGTTPLQQQLYACVLGWRGARDETEYGVLLVRGLPRRIEINDEQSATPSNVEAERWRGLAFGFFSYHKRLTPIIDPAALFGSTQQSLPALSAVPLTA